MTEASPLVLSPASPEDSDFLLALRNHPEVRRWAFEEAEIQPEDHAAWLQAILADSSRRLYVATRAGLLVGSGRLDLWPIAGEAEVSVSICPEFQGQGLGTALIQGLSREACALGVTGLIADIKEVNVGSRKAFAAAGFAIEEYRDGVVRMTRGLP